MSPRKIILSALCFLCMQALHAEYWLTHFAYNNVTQIAMSADKVYALSDGSLFSVDKQSEKLQTYNTVTGLHATGITCIHYDRTGEQLLIAYKNGKLDFLSPQGVRYVGELYDKDMTQRKTIYNVTISGRTAYLSTHYGIQTMNLNEHKLVDSYWLRPGGLETPVKDVLITKDSIYAFTDDSLYCASLSDPLSDYHYWHRERPGRISRDTDKGMHYQDGNNHWYAGQSEGIIRTTPGGRMTYKPDGPLVNIPYRMRAKGSKLAIVQGGYIISSEKRPGLVMVFNNGHWTNHELSGTDVCDVVFDPADPSHFFAASFGYGLYEFRNDALYKHHNPSNSALEYYMNLGQYPYVWVDGLQYDKKGNLWMLNNSYNGVKVLQSNGQWITFSNAACQTLERSKDLLVSVKNPNIKLLSSVRNGIGVFDDNGTLSNASDDRAVLCNEFSDALGNPVSLPRISSFFQTPSGVLLIGTEGGLFRIDAPEELLNGNNLCIPFDLSLPEEDRTNIFAEENVRSITKDDDGHIWIGTQTSGLYCVNAALTEVLAHYSTENSPMPANDVLSLCWMSTNRHLFIGTAEGLVEFSPEGNEGVIVGNDEEEDLDMGRILHWTLHPCYYDPQEVVATPNAIFAQANGSLFSVDREDKHISYWNKSTGLNGSTVSHIAYDPSSGKLVITYKNGQIDLLSADGKVVQMPDILMKAGSIDVNINSVYVGSRYTYLAMPFGIVAMNTKKGEVSDTYYIGQEASTIEVQQVVEKGDSLYAFSYDRIYKASLQDNLVDYTFWHSGSLPCEKVKQAAVYKDALYVLSVDSILYRNEGSAWKQVPVDTVTWFHVSGGQLIVYQKKGQLLSKLTDDDRLELIDNFYICRDAIYTDGQYWTGVPSRGLVRLSDGVRSSYIPDGPISNFGYHLDVAHDQLYVAPGGRWATSYGRQSDLSIFDGHHWRGISHADIWNGADHNIHDAVGYAVDPNDPGHFFVATYATGVFEFRDYEAVQHYDSANSTLRRLAPVVGDYYYTCTDGTMWDEQGNLWVLNATSIGSPVNIRTSYGQWVGLKLRSGGKNISFTTPTGIWTDKRNSQWKWMMDQRGEPCMLLLDDGGTPTFNGDDRCVTRSSFTDQNGNTIIPGNFRCFAQDHTNRIWIGTDKGILIIPEDVDFFTSNVCKRIIIPRNDGTGLGDYLLGDEQINCLAVDGGNRMWIGTENSGLYLIQDDTITVAHFLETNSMLPSNSIQSLAIIPKTGEVFAGTNSGIASYMSDASEAQENMSGAYAFPNPVRPEYGGYISITGLMDNSEVNIVDAGGNLVCKTRSQGGTAVWDGRLPDGRRATAGVYTALCNANGGHAAVKILIIR